MPWVDYRELRHLLKAEDVLSWMQWRATERRGEALRGTCPFCGTDESGHDQGQQDMGDNGAEPSARLGCGQGAERCPGGGQFGICAFRCRADVLRFPQLRQAKSVVRQATVMPTESYRETFPS